MTEPDPMLFSLQKLTAALSLVERRSLVPDTNKRENDVEHSLTVAILCWYIYDRQRLDLDISKILKYALTHDFVERYAGDVNTFASAEARQQKEIDEKASLARLADEFSGFGGLVTTMQDYEQKEDEESLFVWSVDKMQQLIMGDLDGWRCYAELPITYDQFVEKYKELAKRSSRFTKDIFEGLIAYCKTTYYDRPLPDSV